MAWDEKPPKMTECGAPMRAQASNGDGGLGNHGHVDGDDVALADAQGPQAIGELADFIVEFVVGDIAHIHARRAA